MPSKPLLEARHRAASLEAILSALPPRDVEATGEVKAALARAATLADDIAATLNRALAPCDEAEILARSIARSVGGAARGDVVAAYAIMFGTAGAVELVATIAELWQRGAASPERKRAARAAAYELDTLSPATVAPDVPVSRLVDKHR